MNWSREHSMNLGIAGRLCTIAIGTSSVCIATLVAQANAATATTHATVAADRSHEPPRLPDGRENPRVNTFGLSEEVLSRPLVACSIASGSPVEGLTDGVAWPMGIVPYDFDTNVSDGQRSVAETVMLELQTVAGLRFRPRTSEANWIVFKDSTANQSFVGMQGGPQLIEIHNWTYSYIVAHEIMHAIGFKHEHSREDRDDFVTIHFDAIESCPSCDATCAINNFGIAHSAMTVGLYDYDSVMHYGPTAFGCGETTISLNTDRPDGAYIDDPRIPMGQRQHLSLGDQSALISRYGDPFNHDTYVRFGWSGEQLGTPLNPFATLSSALSATIPGGDVHILGGGWSDEILTITTPTRITAESPSTIGN